MQRRVPSAASAIVGGLWGGLTLALDLLGAIWLFTAWHDTKDIRSVVPQVVLVALLTGMYLGSRVTELSRQPKRLQLRLTDDPHNATLKDWLDVVPQDPDRVLEYKRYEVRLRDAATLSFNFAVDLTHHGEQADVASFSVKVDSDWRLLQPLGQLQPQIQLSYHDDRTGGRSHPNKANVNLVGEEHKHIVVGVSIAPKLSGSSDDFAVMGGLSRCDLILNVSLDSEQHSVRVRYEVGQLREQVEDRFEEVIGEVLKHRAHATSLVQRGEMKRFFAYLKDVWS